MYCDSFDDDTDSDPITEANLPEFCRRLMAWQELTGPLADVVTTADIHDRIGLDLDLRGAPLNDDAFDAKLARLRVAAEEGHQRALKGLGPSRRGRTA